MGTSVSGVLYLQLTGWSFGSSQNGNFWELAHTNIFQKLTQIGV